MSLHHVKVKSINKATHDVLQIITEKPQQYNFTPGQATEVAIKKNGWMDKSRPFTFTSLPANDYLEFTIKTYPNHNGVTKEFLHLQKGDELILNDVFGAIGYRGEGLFIAGGAGVTPFISIFRHLQTKNQLGGNKLIFANKTKADIILQAEFSKMLGEKFINILSDEKLEGYVNGMVTEDVIKANLAIASPYFYLCGPPPMMKAVEQYLDNLKVGARHIIKEEF